MTKKQIDSLVASINTSSSDDLQKALDELRSEGRRARATGGTVGALAGAVAGGAMGGQSPTSRALAAILGAAVGGLGGYGAGSLVGKSGRKRVYKEVADRRTAEIAKLLEGLNDKDATNLQRGIAESGQGIQTHGTDYGMFVGGKGTYYDDDKLRIKRDEDGRPLLSLLFAGINSAVSDDNAGSTAKNPLAKRFYNANKSKFSDVQANSIFDDPVVADAYLDKIVAKISSNRQKGGKYPRIRLVGYSAGGRGVVNFLKKMRERDPAFKVDEIIGIDPYQFPWEGIPKNLSDPANPVADRIVYSRLADNYTGSSSKGIGRIGDTISNTTVSLLGKKLNGLAARKVVNNYIPGISHTDAEKMYASALEEIAKLRNEQNSQTTNKKENT